MAVLTMFSLGCRPSSPEPSTQPATTSVNEIPTVAIPQKNIEPEPSPEDKAKAAQYRQLGLDYRSQGRYQDAITALQNSVALDSQNLSGQVILGWTLHLADRPNKATQVLQQALEQDNNHVPALNALGIVYLVNGQLEKAVETHTKAVGLETGNEVGYYNLSLAYHRLEDYESAIANAQQATNLEPNNPHPFVALALAHWDNQDIAVAKQTYQQAIELDPRYREAWFLEHLQQAGFSLQQIQTTNVIRQTV